MKRDVAADSIDDSRFTCLKALLIFAGLLLAACQKESQSLVTQPEKSSPAPAAHSESIPAGRPAPPSDGYVGSAACATCHSKESQLYHGHSMAKSLARCLEASVVEDYDHAEFSPLPQLTYYVEKTADKVIHHEKLVDRSGELIYDQGVPVDYAVGSGKHGRTYLQQRDGRLYASPITWYSDHQKWDLSPGYTLEFNRRFDRRVSEGCLACHAGRVDALNDETHRFAANPFPEESVGCERCHGPGKDHIAYQTARSQSAGADPICNPAKLEPARREAVCNQCHLQGRRRIVRYGRTEFDFRPGMSLSDNWIVFLKTAGIEEGRAAVVSQVEQMQASQCSIKSGQKLGCISCHDPHSIPDSDQKAAHYRDRCLQCHGDGQVQCSDSREHRDALDDSCIACHMPKNQAADVHATQTDHRVLRKPDLSSPADSGAPDDESTLVMKLFQEKGSDPPGWELERAMAIFQAERMRGASKQELKPVIDVLVANVQAHPDDVEAGYILGTAFETIELKQLAQLAWEKVVAARPMHEDAIEALAVQAHEGKDLVQAKKLYQRLIELNPQRSHYYGRLAHVLGQAGEKEAAIAAAKKCLELNPSLMQTHAWLAEVYTVMGDARNAAYHSAIVERAREALNPPGGS